MASDADTRAAGGGSDGSGSSLLTRRRLVLTALLGLSAVVGLYLLAGSLQGFSHTWTRLRGGDLGWLAAAAVLELLSIVGYSTLFFAVVGYDTPRIGWRASLEIPLAGIAALRLLATGGAGGFAVTAWALGRAGMPRRTIGSRMVTSVVVQYAVYMAALIVCGLGLFIGIFGGHGPSGVTLVPALFALGAIVVVLAVAALPFDPARTELGVRLGTESQLSRTQRALHWLLTAGSTLRSGIRAALALLSRARADRRSIIGLLGAIAYWGFDVAVLWCSFRAFGAAPPVAVVVMSYFVGTLAGLLPLPGGIGGIEGGMIGSFIAFGVPAGESVLGVLAYRAISFWLPTLPGIAGYVGLRRTVRGWDVASVPDEPPPQAPNANGELEPEAGGELPAGRGGEAAARNGGTFAHRVGEHRAQRGVEAQADDAAVCRH